MLAHSATPDRGGVEMPWVCVVDFGFEIQEIFLDLDSSSRWRKPNISTWTKEAEGQHVGSDWHLVSGA